MRIAAAAAVLATATACAGVSAASRSGLQLASGAYPITFVLRRVAGPNADVAELAAPGVEPHDLELTPRQLVEVSGADLLFYVGAGFQPAVERAAGEVGGRAVDVLRGQRLLLRGPSAQPDPHVWLDPVRLARVVGVVRRALARVDPRGAAGFAARATALRRALGRLDRTFRRGLRSCERRTFVTTHDAFGYLARRYGLQEVSVGGLDPSLEPSPRRLAHVAEVAARRRVPVVFGEPRAPFVVARAVADEAGAATAVLDPLEEAPARGGFLGAMRGDLVALRRALGCR